MKKVFQNVTAKFGEWGLTDRAAGMRFITFIAVIVGAAICFGFSVFA